MLIMRGRRHRRYPKPEQLKREKCSSGGRESPLDPYSYLYIGGEGVAIFSRAPSEYNFYNHALGPPHEAYYNHGLGHSLNTGSM